MSAALAFIAVFYAVAAVGVIAAYLAPPNRRAAIIAAFGAVECAALVIGGAAALAGGSQAAIALWRFAPLGDVSIGLNAYAAVFILATGLVGLAISIFSASYLEHYAERYDLRYFGLLYHAFLAAMVGVLIARDVLSFLLAWEAMSAVSYLLVAFESDNAEAGRASFVMLAMNEAGMILAALGLLLLANGAGSIDFAAIAASAPGLNAGMRVAIFLLSFAGFGVKTGLLPLNGWLPRAHPVAPTNVSALLSAAMVNLGIYGIALVNIELLPPAWTGAGVLVLAIGAMTSVVGILYATIQSELKQLLAHSTIENMGIVAAALGAAMVFRAANQAVAADIALIAALYHVLNHSLYKALLFAGTGAVQTASGTRDLDRLGGLIHRMRWTAVLVLAGVMAISALPPFNGFVSEWLTLQAILRATVLASKGLRLVFALSGAMLALTAGLAVTCFVKLFAMGFLGLPRSDQAAAAHEAPRTMRWAMGLLAGACLVLGILPTYAIPALGRAVQPLTGLSPAAALVPDFFGGGNGMPASFVADFHNIGAQVGQHLLPGRGLVVLLRGAAHNPVVFAISPSYGVVVFLLLIGAVFVVVRGLTRRRTVRRKIPWIGGIAKLAPALTYTASAFANPVRVVFRPLLAPKIAKSAIEDFPRDFQPPSQPRQVEIHIVDRLVLRPVIAGLEQAARPLRRMHRGAVNLYAAYVLITLLIVFAIWTAIP